MPELTDCYDCDSPISFSAITCPHCGSTEPSGPYRHSRKEQKRLGAEARNDNRMVFITVVCIAVGIIVAALTGHGIFFAASLGVLGALVGPPVAFVVNMLWALRR
ncbi:hypothetical protein AS156_40170 [Bradyrhizobium macuxiense]|uniref:Uncharacterized protein n=1 Tax=Bradyrhizobium macuxiense TaxID=1755647 RepID=A0A109JYA8_9BRAD|nr:hypothetical protein [Bradyrhizobium macuxiense]KWV57270.1 hypothetical protein AS156_40170 [Bradyrhizobium macuxiense]